MYRISPLLFVLCVGVSFLVGCDTTIKPFSGAKGYSVYGNLSFQKEAHFFRVRPLQQPLGSSVDSLNVAVTLTNRSTGESIVLQDSVVVFDGISTHNYWANFKVAPKTTYELQVEGSDRARTTVQTTTPTAVDPLIIPERVNECNPDTGPMRLDIRFRDVESPVEEVRVGFRYEDEQHWRPVAGVEPVPGRDEKSLEFNLTSVFASVVPSGIFVRQPPCSYLDRPKVRIAFLYPGVDRVTEQEDPLTTYDPTRQARVNNGIGFMGAFRRDTVSIDVSTGS